MNASFVAESNLATWIWVQINCRLKLATFALFWRVRTQVQAALRRRLRAILSHLVGIQSGSTGFISQDG